MIVSRDTQINVGVVIGSTITAAIVTVGIICLLWWAYAHHYLSKRRCYICRSPYYFRRRHRHHHTSYAVSLPTHSWSSGSSTTSSDSWRRWYRERERHRRRNARWRMREEFYDRGMGYDNGYRGMWNGGGGWPSPRGGLGLGATSPRLGEARRNTLGGLGGGGLGGAGLGGGGGGLVG